MASNIEGIAVIGMAGKFPGAENIQEFWDNIIEGKDVITHFSDDELAINEYAFDRLKHDPNYVKARGVLKEIDKFDAAFFGMTPKEAQIMDPQHRLWLETSWNAFEDAGCDPFTYRGSIGVFAGSLPNTYLLNNILNGDQAINSYLHLYDTESFQLMVNNDPGFLPTKTAYYFNLKGPAISVQTACSTSLVAINQACQSLYNYESDICLAGGVSIILPQSRGYVYQKGAITSPDGHCRPFDLESNGTVPGNGVAAVVLKRLEDAIDDNDSIYAVVKGWAINNDGNNKVSYTAPSVDGQAECIMLAQAFAEVHPDDISYIETHGTATPLGDPIEISALTNAFREKTDKKEFCAIGSVKANVGHLDIAAGVTGFIKAALIASYKKIPPQAHFQAPNPHIDFKNSPFYISNELTDWEDGKTLNIGVSSFGIGGTNAHAILQEPPIVERTETNSNRPQLFVLSAKSDSALSNRKREFSNFTQNFTRHKPQEFAYTLQKGRRHMPYRSFQVFENGSILDLPGSVGTFVDGNSQDLDLPIAFMFPGQGAQYVNMGKGLYETEVFCKDIFEHCFSIYETETGSSLKELLFKPGISESDEQALSRTEYAQPALFIVEYVIAKYLENFGINPSVLIGHSIGEFTSACVSGVFDVESVLKMVIKRGQLMSKMPSGKMLAVQSNFEILQDLRSNYFEIAAVNSPDLCSISFQNEQANKVKKLLDKKSIEYIELNTSHAFHSAVFNPILDEFSRYVGQFEARPPKIPFISCLTGDYITEDQVMSAQYWSSQLRNTVQFSKGVSTIANFGNCIFLEVGPNTHLTTLVRRHDDSTSKTIIAHSLGKMDQQSESAKILSAIGKLWLAGKNVDFDALHSPSSPQRLHLPSYPFECVRHWVDKKTSPSKFEDLQSPNEGSEFKKDVRDDQNVNEGQIQPDLQSQLKEILCELSGLNPKNVDSYSPFSEMGLESLFLAQFAQYIEKKLLITLEFRQLVHDYPTLASLSEYITRNTNESKRELFKEPHAKLKNFIPIRPDGSKHPLVMVHGDNCDKFLPEALGNDQPYLGFLHIGSDGERFKFNSVHEIAKYYMDQLLAVRKNGPFILGGHSFGGIIAFEMAIQFQKMGYQIPLLILSDSIIPEKVTLFSLKRGVRGRIKLKAHWIYCVILIFLGIPIPVKHRRFYIQMSYDKLGVHYKPSKYNGPLLLFQASESMSSEEFYGWDKVVESIEAIKLQGTHNGIINKADTISAFISAIKEG